SQQFVCVPSLRLEHAYSLEPLQSRPIRLGLSVTWSKCSEIVVPFANKIYLGTPMTSQHPGRINSDGTVIPLANKTSKMFLPSAIKRSFILLVMNKFSSITRPKSPLLRERRKRDKKETG
nr:hypothetical protein [Tanacetum cinerariifolium]